MVWNIFVHKPNLFRTTFRILPCLNYIFLVWNIFFHVPNLFWLTFRTAQCLNFIFIVWNLYSNVAIVLSVGDLSRLGFLIVCRRSDISKMDAWTSGEPWSHQVNANVIPRERSKGRNTKAEITRNHSRRRYTDNWRREMGTIKRMSV